MVSVCDSPTLNLSSHNVECDASIVIHPQDFDKIQLDLLIGLRVVEHLGRTCLSTHAIRYKRDKEPLIQILNWIALFVTPNYTDTCCDIAVALSAEHGEVTVHIANSSGLQSKAERANVSMLISTLRQTLSARDNDPALATSSFLASMVQKAFPEILRKLALVRNTDTNGPEHTLRRFCSLVSFWIQYCPGGECSRGLVDMAAASGNNEQRATDALVQSFTSLMTDQDFNGRQGTVSHKMYAHLIEPAIVSCDVLVHSTFFDDLVNNSQYSEALPDVSDLLFLHKLLKGLSDVACYKRGSAEFAYRGIPYLKRVLGSDGIAKFMQNAGGIRVKWVSSCAVNEPPKVYRWPSSPREYVAEILERDHFDLDYSDCKTREYVVQTETVDNAWKKGDAVTPQLHCELRLIHYIEEHSIAVLDRTLGTSQPVCWACDCYINKLKSASVSGWSMSQTSGKARDDWLLPHEGLDIGRIVLRALNKEMERVVEEYAFERCPG